MAGLPINQCPACTQYIQKKGGRKNGKIEMPDISSPGIIQHEDSISVQFDEMTRDFNEAAERPSQALKNKYVGKKLFGWSVDELEQMKAKRDAQKNK